MLAPEVEGADWFFNRRVVFEALHQMRTLPSCS